MITRNLNKLDFNDFSNNTEKYVGEYFKIKLKNKNKYDSGTDEILFKILSRENESIKIQKIITHESKHILQYCIEHNNYIRKNPYKENEVFDYEKPFYVDTKNFDPEYGKIIYLIQKETISFLNEIQKQELIDSCLNKTK